MSEDKDRPLNVVLCGPVDPAQLYPSEPYLPAGQNNSPVLSTLASALRDRGFTVSIVSLSPEVTAAWSHSADGIDLTLLPQRTRARDRAADFFGQERKLIARELRRVPGDLIHAHWSYEYAWAALSDGRPVLTTVHDAPFTVLKTHRDAYRLLRYMLAWRVRLKMGAVSAVSPYLATQWCREMFWRDDVPVVPNMSPLPVSDPPRTIGNTLVSIGNADPLKNVRSLLTALPAVIRQHPDTTLALIGPGLGPTDELASAVGDFDGRIEWMGQCDRPTVQAAIRRSRAMVHPSLEESQGVALLEAMSQGVPVIAGRDSGAVPWTLGEAGLLVDVRDPAALASAICGLLADSSTQERMSEMGRSRVVDVFSETAVVDGYIQLYGNVVARGNVR